MCLFSNSQQLCRHAECKLIQTITDLNQHVFTKSDTPANRVILPTATTLPYSERNLPRATDGSSRSSSQQIMSEGAIQ